MKKTLVNQTHIEGLLYEHKLELKVSGEKSKNPGTEFIAGTVTIATDDACINTVSVHFTYVTATTRSGGPNNTFNALKRIIDGAPSITANSKEEAIKVRCDSAIGLNEFYSDRGGKEELVSAKRNEGGFLHIITDALNEDEKKRNTFETDMIINKIREVEANEERNTPAKVVLSGYIFDFRKALLPVEFSVLSENGMNYFLGLDATEKSPVFTKVWGRQISQTSYREIVEESAFGDTNIKSVPNSTKDFVVTGAARDAYIWDDEEYITAIEFAQAMQDREVYLAGVKQRQDEYQASRKAGATAAPAASTQKSGYNF